MTRHDAVHFPPIATNNDDESFVCDDDFLSFENACQEAIQRAVPLVLSQDIVLVQTIRLMGQQSLQIKSHDGNKRVTIQGGLHSLFLLNNKSQLIIEDVNLDHTLQTDDHKQVGAAINLRTKAKVSLTRSKVMSASGFCIWAVQKSHVTLEQCHLLTRTRSAVVCFGQTQCQLYHCHVDQPGVHGICARGPCHLALYDCILRGSVARAIYAYAGASVLLEGCHLSGTLHPDKAAVEISSIGCTTESTVSSSSLSSSLILRDCQIVDNQGVGVRIRGPVVYDDQGVNRFERNAKGDWDIVEDWQDNAGEGTARMNHQGFPPLRRDIVGSSFRRGDWLCSQCRQIVAGKAKEVEFCSNCSSQRSFGDRLLTIDEIRKCNMGIDIRQGGLPSSSTHVEGTIIWEFDGDDDKGWILYDEISSQLLEEAYCLITVQDNNGSELPSEGPNLVYLQGGKYQVNLLSLVQINTETQFPRFVRRLMIRPSG
jgi:hypothetical protein